MMRSEVIEVNVTDETVAAHDGTGTGVSSHPIVGKIYAIDVNYGAAQTSTLDITIATKGNPGGGKAETLYTKSNSATDLKVYPMDAEFYPVTDYISVVLAHADNESPAVVVTIQYED